MATKTVYIGDKPLVANGKDGTWLPIATYNIDTTLQTVEARTYTDSAGIITT